MALHVPTLAACAIRHSQSLTCQELVGGLPTCLHVVQQWQCTSRFWKEEAWTRPGLSCTMHVLQCQYHKRTTTAGSCCQDPDGSHYSN